jgi:hypothetical protein
MSLYLEYAVVRVCFDQRAHMALSITDVEEIRAF